MVNTIDIALAAYNQWVKYMKHYLDGNDMHFTISRNARYHELQDETLVTYDPYRKILLVGENPLYITYDVREKIDNLIYNEYSPSLYLHDYDPILFDKLTKNTIQ